MRGHPLGILFSGLCMSDLAGRYTRQLPLFDVRRFTDPSRSGGRSHVRLGPSGKPWIGVEEVNAAAESLRRMVAELQEEITELDSEYRRLVMSTDCLPDAVADAPANGEASSGPGKATASGSGLVPK